MADNFSVFVVEDDEFYSEVLEYHLSLNPDITVTKFTNGKDFLNNLDKNPGAVTLRNTILTFLLLSFLDKKI